MGVRTESELETIARGYAETPRDVLIVELLRMEIRLSEANREIGALKAELDWARREGR